MKFNFNKLFQLLLLTGGTTLLVACNKDAADPVPVAPPASSSTQSLTEVIGSDTTLSFLQAAVTRAGTNISSLLSDRSAEFTLFAPTNAAFRASGISSIAVINAMPAAQVESLLRYHLVGGRVSGTAIPSTFPNMQLPTQIVLAPPSAAVPPGLRMSSFVSKRGANFWANTVPITQTDIAAVNGLLHKVAALLSVPLATSLKGYFATNTAKYSLLLEAVKRADSGLAVSTGLARLDSVLNFLPANLTVFAPNNDAFRALFPPGTPDAAIIAALNTHALFPVQTVRAIVAYHLLGSRALSVNFDATPTPIATQLVIPPGTTGVPVIVSYSGTTLTVKDVRPTSTPAVVATKDVNTINGVVHEIGQVLRPQ